MTHLNLILKLIILLFVATPAFAHDATKSQFVISGNFDEEYHMLFYLNPHGGDRPQSPGECNLSFTVTIEDIVNSSTDSLSFDLSLRAGDSKVITAPFQRFESNASSNLLVRFSKTDRTGPCKTIIVERLSSAVDGSTRSSISSMRSEMLNNKYPENM